jgi:hypothetical protein
VHRPRQCGCCYEIFETDNELKEHTDLINCDPGPPELKEGINLEEWEVIEEFLKIKKGKNSTGKSRMEVDSDNWYKISGLLFPDDDPPSNPCKSTNHIKIWYLK